MLKRIACSLAVAAGLLIGRAAPVLAAPIQLSPDEVLFGIPGSTVGWGYDIVTDGTFELSLTNISATVAGGSTIDTSVFDFPSNIPTNTSLHVDYVPGQQGLVELTLSPLLSLGDIVTGIVSVDFLLRDPLGVFQDQTGTVDIAVSAQVVPEPSTWLLVATGMIAALYRRRRVAW